MFCVKFAAAVDWQEYTEKGDKSCLTADKALPGNSWQHNGKFVIKVQEVPPSRRRVRSDAGLSKLSGTSKKPESEFKLRRALQPRHCPPFRRQARNEASAEVCCSRTVHEPDQNDQFLRDRFYRTFLNDLGGNPNKKNGSNETCLHAACQLTHNKSFSAMERRAACVMFIMQWRGAEVESGGREKIDLAAQDQVRVARCRR